MCHFVTAVLRSKASPAELDAIARKHGRKLEPLSNPSIQRQLQPDQQYFLTTVEHCDCGTALGFDRRSENSAPNWANEEQRLLKKGWSKAKIERALAQKRERAAVPKEGRADRLSAETASWLQLIAEVLGSGKTSEFGLLLHYYRGRLDEDIQLQRTESVRAEDAAADLLRRMHEDVLLTFER